MSISKPAYPTKRNPSTGTRTKPWRAHEHQMIAQYKPALNKSRGGKGIPAGK